MPVEAAVPMSELAEFIFRPQVPPIQCSRFLSSVSVLRRDHVLVFLAEEFQHLVELGESVRLPEKGL